MSIHNTFANLKVNLYGVLGVAKNCPQEDLKSAYFKAALLKHPDKNGNTVQATEDFKLLIEAYSILKDRDVRREYDIWFSETDDEHERESKAKERREYKAWASFARSYPSDSHENVYDADLAAEILEEAEKERARWEEVDKRNREWAAELERKKEESIGEIHEEWERFCLGVRSIVMTPVPALPSPTSLWEKVGGTIDLGNIIKVSLGNVFGEQYLLVRRHGRNWFIAVEVSTALKVLDHATPQATLEDKRNEELKAQERAAPKPRVLYEQESVKELKREREALEMSQAKAYTKARALYQESDYVTSREKEQFDVRYYLKSTKWTRLQDSRLLEEQGEQKSENKSDEMFAIKCHRTLPGTPNYGSSLVTKRLGKPVAKNKTPQENQVVKRLTKRQEAARGRRAQEGAARDQHSASTELVRPTRTTTLLGPKLGVGSGQVVSAQVARGVSSRAKNERSRLKNVKGTRLRSGGDAELKICPDFAVF